MSAVYCAAGVLHILLPGPFLSITPDWAPFRDHIVLLTGLAEIAGAIGLCTPRFRRAAGVGLAVYAICVFPANIRHAIDDLSRAQPVLGWTYHGPRLMLQPVIVWWALWAAAVIDWPFGRTRDQAA